MKADAWKAAVSVAAAVGWLGCGGPAGPGSWASQSQAESSDPDSIPAALAVPAGNHRAFAYEGVGVQIYQCNGSAWVFQAPEATLYKPGDDGDGRVVGHHFAGPTWQSTDGSTVVGKKLAAVTVDSTAIPWLLLQGVSHSGTGRMTPVTYVQRLETQGGLAPVAGCDATTTGQVARSDYSAKYVFSVADVADDTGSDRFGDGRNEDP